MYSIVCTKPNLARATSILSFFMANLGKENQLAMKWLLRYISGTTGYGFVYMKHGDRVEIKGFVDSTYVGDRDNRKSTSAYFFIFLVIVWARNRNYNL